MLLKGLRESVQILENPSSGRDPINGAKRIRTADPLHAMQVLYQLSYGPINAGNTGLVPPSKQSLQRQGLKPDAKQPRACPAPAPDLLAALSVHMRD